MCTDKSESANLNALLAIERLLAEFDKEIKDTEHINRKRHN